MGEEQQERRIDSLITEVFGEGEEAELVRTAIREALGATKRVRQNQRCPKCAHVYRGEFTARDPSLVLKTIEWLADRMVGRPGVQKDAAGGDGHVFVYKVVLPAIGCVNCDCEKCVGAEERRDRELGPGVWDLHDRRDNSDAVFRTQSDLLAYIQGLDESGD